MVRSCETKQNSRNCGHEVTVNSLPDLISTLSMKTLSEQNHSEDTSVELDAAFGSAH